MNQYTKPVRGVLLAAGQGKRMKSGMPKVLHTVLAKPILGRILEAIDALELEHVHIVIGHGAELVSEYLLNNQPRTPWSVHLQEPLLGTGHALMQVAPELKNFEGSLVVSVADCPLIKASTLSGLIAAHQGGKASFSLLTTVVADPKNYGRIIRDENSLVAAIVEDRDATAEQKAIREVNPAIYCLEWPLLAEGLSALSNNNTQKEYYLTDLLAWTRSRNLKVSDAPADWQEVAGINSRLELAECNQHLRRQTLRRLALESGVTILDPESTWIAPEVRIGQETVVLPGCYIMGEVEIGENCTIGPNTQISGPTKIGPGTSVIHSLVAKSDIGADCRIGPFAHLREGACVSRQCRIGNFVEVKKSLIGEHTNVSHLSYIGDALLGREVNIGAGTITANYDRISGRKSRTMIGDRSATGSNSVLVAPVVVGDDAFVGAGTVITKDVPDGALGVARAQQVNIAGWVEKKRGIKDTVELPAATLEEIEAKRKKLQEGK
jgi:bifunctional UDP-N-acetylglucosamine pyrophosphorylase / glucosamine-1-phosphate N-acetyltransferase